MRLNIPIYLAVVLFVFLGHVFGAPLSLAVKPVQEDTDGIVSSYLKLSGVGFEGRRFASSNWVLLSNAAADTSLSFHHRFVPSVTMDFAAYSSAEFLQGLSEDDLKIYVTELAGLYKRKQYTLSEAKAVKAPVASIPFMGSAYWKISYSLAKSGSKDIEKLVLEFVTKTEGGKNYRLRFIGPPESFSKLEPLFEDELPLFLAM